MKSNYSPCKISRNTKTRIALTCTFGTWRRRNRRAAARAVGPDGPCDAARFPLRHRTDDSARVRGRRRSPRPPTIACDDNRAGQRGRLDRSALDRPASARGRPRGVPSAPEEIRNLRRAPMSTGSRDDSTKRCRVRTFERHVREIITPVVGNSRRREPDAFQTHSKGNRGRKYDVLSGRDARKRKTVINIAAARSFRNVLRFAPGTIDSVRTLLRAPSGKLVLPSSNANRTIGVRTDVSVREHTLRWRFVAARDKPATATRLYLYAAHLRLCTRFPAIWKMRKVRKEKKKPPSACVRNANQSTP